MKIHIQLDTFEVETAILEYLKKTSGANFTEIVIETSDMKIYGEIGSTAAAAVPQAPKPMVATPGTKVVRGHVVKDVSEKSGTRFTPDEDQKLIAMRKAGKKCSEIAAALGRSESSIQQRLSHHQVTKPKKSESASKSASDKSTTSDPQQANALALVEEKILQLYNENRPINEIIRLTGANELQVRQVINGDLPYSAHKKIYLRK